MRNPPHARVSQDAVAFVQKLPSIGELFLTNGSSFAREFSETVAVSDTGTLELDDAVYSYGVAEDGRLVITNCDSKALRLAVPAEIAGMPVKIIAAHSFSMCYSLEHIDLPASVEEIHGYSFMNTALETFEAPANLRYIGCKTFYKCKRLSTVTLNEGLLSIGDSAFRESGLASVEIPSTVMSLGQGIFDGTGILCGAGGLTVSPDNRRIRLKGGALYEIAEDGWALLQLVDEEAVAYDGEGVSEGKPLLYVADRAFADKKKLRSIKLPEGVVSVGEAAFRGCPALTEVHLPDSLETIGLKAFWETALPALHIPASLRTVGTAAFHTGSTVSGVHDATVRHVSVAPDNPVFCLLDGMLCMRTPDGGYQILLYTGQENPTGDVVIPREVTSIGPYAFSNAKGLRSLRLHSGIHTVDISGFDFGAIIPDIYYDDLETGETYTIRFPPGSHGYTYMRQAFNRGVFELEQVYELLDRAIMVTRDPLARAQSMLDRLTNPVFADEATLKRYRERLTSMLAKTVVEFGRNGFPQGIDMLLDVGVLRKGNIEEAIDAAQSAGEVAVLSRLMEIRRTQFGAVLFDFDL